ncbi:MAG TPA: hypothetical protein DCG19_02655 [Cryomorphaceae bacterium]|nr:hypothetical protein [Owenweeksia sp.]HAD96275.1 hypothetical protein [Cryomorphaceae bacterium]HBF18684.1 hypothetical protein [Cryomorphaceae bacterium]HCQ15302.1 hypothetical protein [Cryomorphaceae bacterium]
MCFKKQILKGEKLSIMKRTEITSIQQLRKALSKEAGHAGYSAIVDSINIPVKEIEPYQHWNGSHHTRVSLFDSEPIEAVLTCWEPGQSSAIHNYDFKQGWVLILQGQLYLELYHLKNDRPVEVSEIALRDKGVFYLNDGMGFHRFSNNSPHRSLALFLYASKVKRWTTFNVKTGSFDTVETRYDHRPLF